MKEFQGISFPNAILSVHKLLARKFNVKPIELEATKNLVSFSSNLQSECLGTKCHQSFEIENTQDFSIFWSTNTLHMKVMQRNLYQSVSLFFLVEISISLYFYFLGQFHYVKLMGYSFEFLWLLAGPPTVVNGNYVEVLNYNPTPTPTILQLQIGFGLGP